jgi:hypothetical protein
LKNSFKKLLFILPLVTFLLATLAFTQKIEIQKTVGSSTTLQNHPKNKQLLSFVLSSDEEKDLIYNETESSESEIELEQNLFNSFQDNFLQANISSGPFSDYTSFYQSNRKISLYDLFCSWKLHIC